MSGGASRETWAFDAVGADGSATALVLRRDPPGRPGEPGAHGPGGPGHAAAGGRPRRARGPAQQAMSPGLLGTAGLVMRRVEGETIARRILRDDAYARRGWCWSGSLARSPPGCTRSGPLPGLPAPGPAGRAARGKLGAFGPPGAVFERPGLRRADPPPPRDPVTVHGDLRLGNLIVAPRGLAAVSTGNGCTPATRPRTWAGCASGPGGSAGRPGAGLGSREDLLAAYRAAGGADIGLDELRWWEILGTLRWGVICMAQARAHLSGAHRSVELAAIGRRVCEQEWDLLLLLAPEAAAGPRPGGRTRAPPGPDPAPTAGPRRASCWTRCAGTSPTR